MLLFRSLRGLYNLFIVSSVNKSLNSSIEVIVTCMVEFYKPIWVGEARG